MKRGISIVLVVIFILVGVQVLLQCLLQAVLMNSFATLLHIRI